MLTALHVVTLLTGSATAIIPLATRASHLRAVVNRRPLGAQQPSLAGGLRAAMDPWPVAVPTVAVLRCAAPRAVATSVEDNELDGGSLGRYLFAVLIQIILITTAFGVVDLACYGQLRGDIQLGGPLPWQAVVAIFLALSVRSRIFSPLDNSRPELRAGRVSAEEDVELEAKLNAAKGKTRIKDLQGACEQRGLAFNAAMDRADLERRLRLYLAGAKRKEFMGGSERLRPSWTPPGVTFPIMWVLVVAPLRAFASSLVYETSTGRLNEARLNDPVLLWLVLHLCIGDTWKLEHDQQCRAAHGRCSARCGAGVALGALCSAAVLRCAAARGPAPRRHCSVDHRGGCSRHRHMAHQQ